MSLSRRVSRRGLLLSGLGAGTAVGLAACGFTPVYGPGGGGTRLFGKVRPVDPVDGDGFMFVRRISERLGPDQGAVYALDYRITTATVPQAITPDQDTTRYALNGTVDFSLTEIATGRKITSGQASSFTSYSASGTVIATTAAERDAHQRLAVMLADQVITRLLAAAP
ncbi:LPS assembly lipoprotein LptE [Paracoccus pacificus]|uniref:LPS assembly lipoprotein LptE n=1 Tax=Paracoccus pacificus TaxID=1463598 RepID=A0ABW4R411_9RHOB